MPVHPGASAALEVPPPHRSSPSLLVPALLAVAWLAAAPSTLPGARPEGTEDEAISEISFSTIPGDVAAAGGGEPITLDADVEVNGAVRLLGVRQLGTGPLQTYEVSLDRYVVDARPAEIGVVVPLDHALVQALCRDDDGCEVALVMLNWDGGAGVASRTARLFLSTTTGAWRFSDIDISGIDGTGTVHEWATWDCIFTDAESYTGTPNSVADIASGFGLLNAEGGDYSDATTICRVVLLD